MSSFISEAKVCEVVAVINSSVPAALSMLGISVVDNNATIIHMSLQLSRSRVEPPVGNAS